jgi:hypothetical protein
MAIQEIVRPGPDFLDDLVHPEDNDGLILYPDRVETHGGDLIAAYRPDAQALRILAAKRGVTVVIAGPEDAKKAIYSEHAADWVLPLIDIPTGVVAALMADYLKARLKAWKEGSQERRSPLVRYREVDRSPDGQSQVREIEGPAEDVMAWLRENRE